ncbi:MAG TPA: alcohol dehydrogenase [Gammaproteobacteria bacterium]|nr:alcohol dehydrogenase [Gammaproteobacteria bacterium]
MKAVLMTAAGGPEVLKLEEVPEPQITHGRQIKVRLRAAGVNPIDTKLRSRGVFYENALPAILGCDGAGEVVAVGDEVSRFQVGDAVWFCHGGLGGAPGNYAEYTVLDESLAAPKPDALSFVEAAAAPLVLITAWEALHDRARLKPGRSVLVHGGGGGVGHVAIQLAALAGAQVCTTVGTEEKAELAEGLGADKAILYPQCDFVEAVRQWSDGRGVDVALDTVGGKVFRRTMSAMAHYGDLVTLLDPGTDVAWKEARNRNLRIGFELMLTPMLEDFPEARRHQVMILEQCGRWFDEGRLRIHIGMTFPLAQAGAAHALLETGHMTGKAVLTIEP